MFRHNLFYRLADSKEENGLSPAAYTKNQLQLVRSDEQDPDADVYLNKDKVSEQSVIKKIVQIKKKGGVKYVLVKWVGYKDPTWEPYKSIKADQPMLIMEFEANLK